MTCLWALHINFPAYLLTNLLTHLWLVSLSVMVPYTCNRLSLLPVMLNETRSLRLTSTPSPPDRDTDQNYGLDSETMSETKRSRSRPKFWSGNHRVLDVLWWYHRLGCWHVVACSISYHISANMSSLIYQLGLFCTMYLPVKKGLQCVYMYIAVRWQVAALV